MLTPSRGVVIALSTACLALALGWGLPSARDYDHDRGRPIDGPANFGFSSVVYERHPRLKLDRLVVVAKRKTGSDADVRRALHFMSSVLSHRRPFSVLYDMREINFPTLSRRQLGMGVEWAHDHAAALDRQLQCIAFIFRSRIVRATASLVINFLSPPQPVHIGKDEASAFRFAQEKCAGKVRDWSAASQERDLKHGRRKWN